MCVKVFKNNALPKHLLYWLFSLTPYLHFFFFLSFFFKANKPNGKIAADNSVCYRTWTFRPAASPIYSSLPPALLDRSSWLWYLFFAHCREGGLDDL